MAVDQKKITSKSYTYSVIDISEAGEAGYKAIIPKFPKLHILADTPNELHQAVKAALQEEIGFYRSKKIALPKPDIYKCSGKFILRIRPEIHELLTSLSKAEGSTLNQYVNRIIEDAVC